jgi:hypothetical protein
MTQPPHPFHPLLFPFRLPPVLLHYPSLSLPLISSSLAGICSSNPRLKQTIALRVDRIVLTYDPTSSIKSKLGGDESYLSNYNFDLSDDNVLTWTRNLANWDDSLYYAGRKLKPLFTSQALVEYVKFSELVISWCYF